MHNNISNKYIKAITWLFKCRSNANLSMKDVNLQKPMEHLFIMFSLFNYLLHITATVLIYVSIYIYISTGCSKTDGTNFNSMHKYPKQGLSKE